MAPIEISRMSVANFLDFFLRMSEETNYVVSGMRLLLAFYWAKLNLASSKERKYAYNIPRRGVPPLFFLTFGNAIYPIYHLKHSQLVLLITSSCLSFLCNLYVKFRQNN